MPYFLRTFFIIPNTGHPREQSSRFSNQRPQPYSATDSSGQNFASRQSHDYPYSKDKFSSRPQRSANHYLPHGQVMYVDDAASNIKTCWTWDSSLLEWHCDPRARYSGMPDPNNASAHDWHYGENEQSYPTRDRHRTRNTFYNTQYTSHDTSNLDEYIRVYDEHTQRSTLWQWNGRSFFLTRKADYYHNMPDPNAPIDGQRVYSMDGRHTSIWRDITVGGWSTLR